MAKILRSNQQELPPSKESIWGMALGISSLFRMWLALPLGITGLIISIIALNKVKNGEAGGRTYAITGLVTSILGIIGVIIVLLIYGAIFAGLFASSPEDFFNVAY